MQTCINQLRCVPTTQIMLICLYTLRCILTTKECHPVCNLTCKLKAQIMSACLNALRSTSPVK